MASSWARQPHMLIWYKLGGAMYTQTVRVVKRGNVLSALGWCQVGLALVCTMYIQTVRVIHHDNLLSALGWCQVGLLLVWAMYTQAVRIGKRCNALSKLGWCQVSLTLVDDTYIFSCHTSFMVSNPDPCV